MDKSYKYYLKWWILGENLFATVLFPVVKRQSPDCFINSVGTKQPIGLHDNVQSF